MLLTFIYFLSISFQGEGAHAELTVPFGRRNPCSATALHEKNIIVSMRNAASLCREVYDDAKSFKLAGYCARVCEICSVRGERESYRNLNRTRPPLCYVLYPYLQSVSNHQYLKKEDWWWSGKTSCVDKKTSASTCHALGYLSFILDSDTLIRRLPIFYYCEIFFFLSLFSLQLLLLDTRADSSRTFLNRTRRVVCLTRRYRT